MKCTDLVKSKCSMENYQKLHALNNRKLYNFITNYVEICNPSSVYVCNDSEEDRRYIQNKAIALGEEMKLSIEGHTIHFDGHNDQARAKANTKYLLPKGVSLGEALNTIDKEAGLEEMHSLLKNIMSDKEMYVLFFCLGPLNSEFSIPCVQITDSSYVAHSEYILYRKGYEQFKQISNTDDFFRYVHSAGDLTHGVSKNIDNRRVYIDLAENIVYSINTQYAGNTVGLKKLSLRLAINKASQEGWLAEHMLIMGIHGPNNRKTYFTGAFPSACGKTSTAMLPGETIIGDDIAYLRKRNGKIYAANVECGIFGIIRDVNPKDDPIIWESLTNPGEVIFSNVLLTGGGIPYWLGDGREIPEKGINYSGNWIKGNKDNQGKEISHAHKNARYTISLYSLKNVDPKLDDPHGIEIKGLLYGGRNSNIWPPVQESFNWIHGVVTMAAALESETTAATLGKEGVLQFNPMSNLDFLAIPLSRYVDNYLKFADGVDVLPFIFSVNYFLKDKDGNFITAMEDKRVWVKWMELRVNKDVEAIKTPAGFIPLYEDLKRLFREVLEKNYDEKDYIQQFVIRIKENLAKIERIRNIYKTKTSNTPAVFFTILDEQKQRLEDAQAKHGDYVMPNKF